MTAPIKVLDGHMHLLTVETHQEADPTGAGDAFNAGFVFGRLSGWPIGECLMWGNACGALTAAHPSGSGAFTDRDEVEAFIRSREGS